MISWIFSLLLYIGTILAGLYIDTKPADKYRRLRKIYVAWLYIFLCFGYMTGSDWRNYEITYETGTGLKRFLSEPASWFVFSYFPSLISDYWIFAGIAKCCYLYTAKLLVSSITPKWLSVLALLIPSQLAFMLIQNPFRFMLAAGIVNIVLYLFIKYKTNPDYHNKKTIVKIFILTLLSVTFHNASVVLLILIPLLFLSNTISKINSFLIFISYFIVTIVTSSLSFIHDLKQFSLIFLQRFMEISDYENYELEDNSSIFSIGNMLKFLFLIYVLSSKKTIVKKFDNGGLLFGMTIIYFFVSRIVILIPTGFRLALPFITLYVVYTIYMLASKKILAQLIIIYTLASFGSQLWKSYDFIPYSNSIPYILTGHKPFQERHMYNLNEYKARTGEDYDMQTDVEL